MRLTILCLALALVLPSTLAAADEPKPADKGMVIEKVEPPRAGLGDTLKVKITNWPKDGAVPVGWVLYLDGVALKGVHPDNADVRDGVFRFYLRRDDVSKPAWDILLRQHQAEREVAVAVGPESGAEKTVAPLTKGFTLTVTPVCWYWILLAVLFILLGVGAWKLNLLRDRDTSAENKPLSLGRTQMAFWTVVILASYIYIGLVTTDFLHTMTATALTLMGISAATGMTAVLIDSDKKKQVTALQAKQTALDARITNLQPAVTNAAAANPVVAATVVSLNNELQQEQTRKHDVDSQLQQKAPTANPSADNPITDLLTDADGLSLHRLQIVAWTLTLGIVFICKVSHNLAMPEFDGTLLTLMGISSGTYLGFKFPEKKA
jgi:hypothetical protein